MSIKKTALTSSSLLVLAVLFVALVILSNLFLKGARLDLTENRLYTLSEGTKNTLAEIDEPINLYYFYSEQASRSLPSLRPYAERVRELLEEYALRAGGKIKLQVIDPLPFSEDEDRAARFGLQAVPLGNTGETLYFGLAGTNSVDGAEAIAFFQPDKEPFLEYDVTKMVYRLANPDVPVIGVLSSLPINGGFNPAMGQPQQPWVIADQINQLFEVRNLAPELTDIEDDVDVLMLVHPKDLSDATLYAIDQFVLGGGRALVFLDPQAEAEQPPGNPQMAMFAERSSELPKLLDAWGVGFDKSKIVGDAAYALQVSTRPGQPPVRHVGIISLDRRALADDDVLTGELSNVNLSMSGHVTAVEGAKTTLTPLLQSSDQAMLIDAEQARFMPDPTALLKDFTPSGERYLLGARVSGEVSSAFPDGPPSQAGAETDADKTDDANAETEKAADGSEDLHLASSQGAINVVVFADTDLLTDRLWVRVSNFFGQQVANAWANNGDLVINALDNLLGNEDLIGMRSRATSNRPFTTVQDLERQASERYRAKEQELEARLQETEQRLNELQAQRGEAQSEGGLMLTTEQRAEAEKFQQQRLLIRNDLRQVRRDLDKDIERLGGWLKFINIGLVPIVLSLLALIATLVLRRARRRADVGASTGAAA